MTFIHESGHTFVPEVKPLIVRFFKEHPLRLRLAYDALQKLVAQFSGICFGGRGEMAGGFNDSIFCSGIGGKFGAGSVAVRTVSDVLQGSGLDLDEDSVGGCGQRENRVAG